VSVRPRPNALSAGLPLEPVTWIVIPSPPDGGIAFANQAARGNDTMSSTLAMVGEDGGQMASVLLVMDDLFFRKLLRRQLEASGHEVAEALSVERGLQRVRDHGADIVLLDTWVDRGGGLRLLEALRADGEHEFLPVLLVGADTRLEVRTRAGELGATASIPFHDAGDVVLWVEEVLAGGSPPGIGSGLH
jgi:CheY-like chemotaxis protein